jgi:hypothetical protein
LSAGILASTTALAGTFIQALLFALNPFALWTIGLALLGFYVVHRPSPTRFAGLAVVLFGLLMSSTWSQSQVIAHMAMLASR